MKWILMVLVVFNLSFVGYQFWYLNQQAQGGADDTSALINNLALSTSQKQRLEASGLSVLARGVTEESFCIRIEGLTQSGNFDIAQSRLGAIEIYPVSAEKGDGEITIRPTAESFVDLQSLEALLSDLGDLEFIRYRCD